MSIRIVLIGPYSQTADELKGGVEACVTRLARALSETDEAEVTVICPGDPNEPSAAGAVRVRRGPLVERHVVSTAFRAWRSFVATQLDEAAPHLVHGHGLLAHGLAATEWHRGPRVVTAHGNPWYDTWTPCRSPRNVANASVRVALGARTTRAADLIISPNRRRRVNLRARPRRFAYIPNAVDARFMEATRQPIAGRVLFCGGEHPIKGFAELRVAWPEVLRRCSTASLEATGFARPAEQSALPAAEVLGPLPTSALLSALERAELLVLPSHFEVSPNLVVEAWAAGTPVIASSVGGIPVLGGDAVQRVRPGDPQALAAAIVAGLRGELDLEGLARRGRRRAVAHLPGAVATRHLAAYTSLLEASVPSRERAEPARCD